MVQDLYVDPATHDLLAVVRTLDDGWTFTRVVEAAGVADSTSVEPNPSQSSIPPAPSS